MTEPSPRTSELSVLDTRTDRGSPVMLDVTWHDPMVRTTRW